MASPVVIPVLAIVRVATPAAEPLAPVTAVPTGVVLVPTRNEMVSPETTELVAVLFNVATSVTWPPLALLPEPETLVSVVAALLTVTAADVVVELLAKLVSPA